MFRAYWRKQKNFADSFDTEHSGNVLGIQETVQGMQKTLEVFYVNTKIKGNGL
jgi:hypothetical protein